MIPTFRPWTHTSDGSYVYQLSLVVATATVSFSSMVFGRGDAHLSGGSKLNNLTCGVEKKNRAPSGPGVVCCGHTPRV